MERWVVGQFTSSGKWKSPPRGGDWGRDPAKILEDDEFREVLAECLGKLPPRAAEALRLRERDDLAVQQIGKILELSPTNIGVILHRARTALRRCLELRWFGKSKRKGETGDDDVFV